MLDKFKNAFQFQQQARQIQKELKNTQFTASSSSGSVTVIANGMQRIEEVKLQLDEETMKYPTRLERDILDVTNKVLDKAQKVSAEKMKTIMGGMGGGLPGM